ncbi:putative bifunctional diguanylate cyclase/phosphodiesterase [Shimia abyssi]|uniref:Diguanylate cyclase/phosphodiesterase n=1 Tax=Shimia abyssi TaxID=1662395 RepID=A0A2P8FH42_9RHOB|nr:bifunctional diguanylate cyclase/phosphodiesterase [Shimia abyssi]PSL20970.1 diguanylate cyclase/phosphodiesterase [Shimia abyssi]
MPLRPGTLLPALKSVLRKFTGLWHDFPLVFPVATMLAWIIAGEKGLLVAAFLLPLPLLLSRDADTHSIRRRASENDGLTGLFLPATFDRKLEAMMGSLPETGRTTACFSVKIDHFARLRETHGDSDAEEVLRATANRICAALRSDDLVCRSGDATFIIALDPVRILDLESSLQLAVRLQTAIEEPVPLKLASIYATCSIGFCLAGRLRDATARSLVQATEMAMSEARRAGESNIRAYTVDMRHRVTTRRKTEGEAARTLERDQIRAWYQPQISTDTGQVTGFEVLARWEHPERGILAPNEFLDVLTQTGQMSRLADYMLGQALNAVRAWDEAGLTVPMVGVNFSGDELRSPSLLDRIKWELDRTDLEPTRISVEILESVIAGSPDDMVVRNVDALSNLGCMVDLDDFGTGHASISSIRRLSISRLKIDRSFVTHVDTDPEQQRMIAAIITMAERLGLETLAEGVETAGEHTMLAQLGCKHVQGFGIACPMPFADTIRWIEQHRAKLCTTPEIGRKSG